MLWEKPIETFATKKRKLLRAAQILVREGRVEPDPITPDTYIVHAVTFIVSKERGKWVCNCDRYKHHGVCEDVLAVEMLENEKWTGTPTS